MNEREDRLPLWAREKLSELRRQVRLATEQQAAELARLRPQVQLLKARNEALTELLECAAKGGHKTAHEIMEIIRAYDLTLTPRD